MKISIIIPTYNEKLVLEDCIESLGEQTLEDFEIILVDDGSTDGTVEILRNLQSTISNFHFFEQKHQGAGAARNLGAERAKGENLVFVDADMTFDKDFLKKLVEPIEKGEAKGTFSKEEYVSNWDNPWARCWNINEGWEEKRRHPKNYPDYQPVFRAILKSEFDKVGGFTPGGYDDDWSLYKKLGYEAVNAPGAVFYHKNPPSLGEIFDHAKWVGKRKYKLGILGDFVALMRSSLPISLIVGINKGIINNDLRFMIFKITYDFGTFVGILEFLLKRKSAK
ncbi:MAG: glycosyltransferase family 2 protein [Candidatus Microgenomates bacterium]|jgi:glycosyltransferase involved in cell wall biosynthesis